MKKKKILKKIVSLFIMVALMINIMPIAEFISVITAYAESTYNLIVDNSNGSGLEANMLSKLGEDNKEYADVSKITITGSMVNTDFDTIKTTLAPYVTEIDISGVTRINNTYSGSSNFGIPSNAFCYNGKTGYSTTLSGGSKYTELIYVRLPESIKSIGTDAFLNCTNLALTSLPEGITTIAMSAFNSCTNLALTSLPAGITTIGASAFNSCTNLALTSLPKNLKTIEGSAFYKCTNLALTSLPEGITTIGTNAFESCTKLALTSLPKNLETIRSYAFYNCTNLALTSLPEGITTIEMGAFYNCTNLALTSLPENLDTI